MQRLCRPRGAKTNTCVDATERLKRPQGAKQNTGVENGATALAAPPFLLYIDALELLRSMAAQFPIFILGKGLDTVAKSANEKRKCRLDAMAVATKGGAKTMLKLRNCCGGQGGHKKCAETTQ